MKLRISQLWKVPFLCTASGYLTYFVYLSTILIDHALPDDSVITVGFITTILTISQFIVTLAVGYFMFRKMTKPEILLSSTIMFVLLLIIALMIYLDVACTRGILFSLVLMPLGIWSRIIPLLCNLVTENAFVGVFVNCLVPFLFVPFGKSKPKASTFQSRG